MLHRARTQQLQFAGIEGTFFHLMHNAAHQRQGKVARILRFSKCVTL
jgi:hypothetical protein